MGKLLYCMANKFYYKNLFFHSIVTLVDDDICKSQYGEKPTETRPCNQGDSCSQWHLGPWSPVRSTTCIV